MCVLFSYYTVLLTQRHHQFTQSVSALIIHPREIPGTNSVVRLRAIKMKARMCLERKREGTCDHDRGGLARKSRGVKGLNG